MTSGKAESEWTVLNPLPRALAHYEEALVEEVGEPLRSASRVHIDAELGPVGRLAKGRRAIAALLALRGISRTGDGVVVLWPVFGFADLALWRLRGSGRRLVVIHDPEPLRHQYGYARIGGLLGRWGSRGPRVEVVAHTRIAADALQRRGIKVRHVLDHPIMPRQRTARSLAAPVVVQVLGQFKEARDLNLLRGLAERAPTSWCLRIAGRGWPEVPGWEVDSRFLSEEEMDQVLSVAHVVLLPYRHYFQSGIATRAYELGVPVAGMRHEFLANLYGKAWPGLANNDSPDAVLSAISRASSQTPPNPVMERSAAVRRWRTALTDSPMADMTSTMNEVAGGRPGRS